MAGRLMWARKRIDITWSDLAFALRVAMLPPRSRPAFDEFADDSMPCLSVRSGLDLFLTAKDFPAGSEILVSAITIPDMVRVIEAHGLVAVPFDIEPSTLNVDYESLKSAITDRTQAVIVAHLFGAIAEMDLISDLSLIHI